MEFIEKVDQERFVELGAEKFLETKVCKQVNVSVG
jgi:hypothetical protein